MPTVAERLDLPPQAKLLILNCADLGLCHAATVGGLRRSPRGDRHQCLADRSRPMGAGIGIAVPGEDVGVQLTLNAEHDLYRWGPINPGPVAARRGRRVSPYRKPTFGITRISTKCGVSAALRWRGRSCGGSTSATWTLISIALVMRPEFFDVYLELAVDFGLPLRLLSAEAEPNVGFPVRRSGR